MKVSVVIPAYNEEQIIEATLCNLLKQDYPDFEIIVVDNASTDRTGEIAKAVAARSHKIRVVREDKKGLLHAREAGRRAATGDIIANMDADCVPDSDWISTGIAHFTGPHIVIVSGPYDYFDGKPGFRFTSLWIQKLCYGNIGLVLQFLNRGALIIGGNNFIRAAALEKIGGYTTSIAFWGEDTDTAKKLSREGKINFSNSLIMKTSARRFHNQGITRTFTMYIFYFFKVTFKKKPISS